ncbi:stromal 70 kDa heat shock-related protein, chloroplastic-like [Castanea sativa]|uniref:stromal 70 kDa heat shock-related protein, chloroplastic-like n=1 Tax=Castanea sativa TaxID=21020 RepID=UPI003F652107
MVNEAERFAKDYKEKRDAIDTKNQAESVVYQTEKQLKELGEMRFLPQRKGASGQSLYNQRGAPSTRPRPTPGGESKPSESSSKEPEGDLIDADFNESN